MKFQQIDQFAANLVRFITDSRGKKAIPILITPVARRKFDSSGRIEETHATYAAIVRRVAAEQRVPLIDLDKESQQLFQQFGPESSKFLFNYLVPGENPNYPDGKQDDTHFNELGARRVAELVLNDIKRQHIALADHIVIPVVKPVAGNAILGAAGVTPGKAAASPKMIVVAADGSGNYRTVQAALDAVPLYNKTAITIFIKNGFYRDMKKKMGDEAWALLEKYTGKLT